MERRRFRSDEVRAVRASRFGALLSDSLYELGLTHKDLAQELGVPRYTVDSWTRGDDSKVPGEANLARLCALLESRKPGLGRALAGIAGLAWSASAPAAPPPDDAGPGTQDPRLTRTAAHPDLTNIPLPLTSFVGRERELAEIRRLFPTTRLLTLTGMGGIGKTRLSLRAGAELLPVFHQGVWLVELGSIASPGLVAQVAARMLGVREQAGRPLLDSLIEHLQPKRALLILDNCEHLIDECATLAAALLQACPRLAILATSREPLRVPGETVMPLPALSLPDPNPNPRTPIHDPRSYEAVRLFAERAGAGRPGFTITTENQAPVIRICRCLDGMPLAIELAAACVRSLSPEEVADLLADRFSLLVAGSRVVLPRHQTLRAAVDWSYDLLSQPERVLLARLSVFADGWTIEAAQAVCSPTADPSRAIPIPGPPSLVPLLIQLADKSLVVVESSTAHTRYSMLETIREYGREKLAEAGDSGLFESMARYFAHYVEAHATDYDGLEAETPNVLAALQIAHEKGLHDALITGANAFYHFLETRGLYGIADMLLQKAIQAARATGDRAGLMATLLNLGRLEERRGNYSTASDYYGEGVGLAREAGEIEPISALLQNMGGLEIRRGNYTQAEALLLEGLALAREVGDRERISAVLGNLGSAAGSRGDYALAELYCVESLALARLTGNKERMSALLQNLGVAASNRGDYAQAEAYYLESLEIAHQIGHREQKSHLLQKLGEISATRGNYEQAETYYREGLDLAREIENRERMSGLLVNLGVAAGRAGNHEEAGSYFRESLDLARAIGHQRLIGKVLHDWGESHLAQGRLDLAHQAFSECLAVSQGAGSRDQAGEALYGLARVASAQGDADGAYLQGRQSASILEQIGHKGAAEVRQWLSRSPAGAHDE